MRIINQLTTRGDQFHGHAYGRLRQGGAGMITRGILTAVLLVAVLATVASAQYGASYGTQGAKKADLTGTWLLTITPDGPDAPPPFEGLYTFTSDGIALFSSVGPPIPGLGNPGQGIWVRTGPTTFTVTWKQFTFDDIFTTNGSLVARSNITVTGANEFTSIDTVKLFDLNGNEIVTLSGSERGRRMKIE